MFGLFVSSLYTSLVFVSSSSYILLYLFCSLFISLSLQISVSHSCNTSFNQPPSCCSGSFLLVYNVICSMLFSALCLALLQASCFLPNFFSTVSFISCFWFLKSFITSVVKTLYFDLPASHWQFGPKQTLNSMICPLLSILLHLLMLVLYVCSY